MDEQPAGPGLSNPHDRFFKETFSRIEVARDFFSNYLPADVLAVLNLETLELRPGSFVDPELKQHFADLLYTAQTTQGATYLYLLLEHKSYPERQTPLQLLRYLVRIWEEDVRTGRELQPIVPLVVYHGQARWQIATNFAGLFSGPEPLRPYWPSFAYELHDLSQYSDEEIRGVARARLALLVMKHIYDRDLADRLADLLLLLHHLKDARSALEYLRTVLIYVAAASDRIAEPELAQAAKTAFIDGGGDIMPTLVEQWIEQGIEQGIAQAQRQTLQENILELLDVRFGDVPEDIAEVIEKTTDVTLLRTLLRHSALAESLDAFAETLADLTRPDSNHEEHNGS